MIIIFTVISLQSLLNIPNIFFYGSSYQEETTKNKRKKNERE